MDTNSLRQPLTANAVRNLHAGCGYHRLEGWLNLDRYPTEATDVVGDLERGWPIATNSQAQVYCSHTLEHLADWRAFFQEAWRVLQPEGVLRLRVPYGGHPAAWWDFGHVRPYFVENFVAVQPGYSRQIGNPQHDGWDWPFSVEQLDVRLSRGVVEVLRRLPWRWLRQRALPWLCQGALAIEELFVTLRPLKSTEAVQAWMVLHAPNVLACQYSCWQHHWEGRELARDEAASLRLLGMACHLNGYT